MGPTAWMTCRAGRRYPPGRREGTVSATQVSSVTDAGGTAGFPTGDGHNLSIEGPNSPDDVPDLSDDVPVPTVDSPNNSVPAPKSRFPKQCAPRPERTAESPNSPLHSPNLPVHSPNPTVHSPNPTVHSPNPTVDSPRTLGRKSLLGHCPSLPGTHSSALSISCSPHLSIGPSCSRSTSARM